MRTDLVKDVDYYVEKDRVVFTAKYLKDRGFCCKSGCRHCPYPKTTGVKKKQKK